MTDDDRRRAASAVLEIPFFVQMWAEMEEAAVNAAIHAKYDDHEARQSHCLEAKAIRQVLSRLRSFAKEGQPEPVSRRAPA